MKCDHIAGIKEEKRLKIDNFRIRWECTNGLYIQVKTDTGIAINMLFFLNIFMIKFDNP